MGPEAENPIGSTIEIHPYVQSRLRSLSRQKETAGILLGATENGITKITGFKRVPPQALRQAAAEAGPELAGFYRLQSNNVPTMRREDKELWQASLSRVLFLLIRPADGDTPAEATAWIRSADGAQTVEVIMLEEAERPQPELPLPAPGAPVAFSAPRASRIPWCPIALMSAPLAIILAIFNLWPPTAAPVVHLDLQARPGELTALWDQRNGPKGNPQSATLLIRDGEKEQIIDLTRNFTPQGRIVLHPVSRDIVMTLTVRYAGAFLLSRSATYIGFTPIAVTAAETLDPEKDPKRTGPRGGARSSRMDKASTSELNAQP